MMDYYRANYPRVSSTSPAQAITTVAPPKVQAPVLMFHGLEDKALHHRGLNSTWEWLEEDLTLVTIPGAGHWVHEDAQELVTDTMSWWLSRSARR